MPLSSTSLSSSPQTCGLRTRLMKPGPATSTLAIFSPARSFSAIFSASCRGLRPASFASTIAAFVAISPWLGSRGGSTTMRERSAPDPRIAPAAAHTRASISANRCCGLERLDIVLLRLTQFRGRVKKIEQIRSCSRISCFRNARPLRSSASGVHRGAVGKHDGRTERRASTGITSSHDRGHVIAAGIEAGDRLSMAVKHACIRIRAEPRTDRDVSRPHRERVERRRGYWADARIWFVVGIAIEPVELNFPLREIDIDTGFGKAVVTHDRAFELLGINGDLLGEILNCASTHNIAIVDEFPRTAVARIDDSQAVFSQEGAIADKPRRNRWRRFVALEHRQHEVMVRCRFIDEAPAGRIHRNHSRLGAVEHKVGELALAAVAMRYDRDWRPQSARALLGADRSPEVPAEMYAVSAVSFIAHGVRRHGLRHESLAQRLIVRIAARRKHDALACSDRNVSAAHSQSGTFDSALVADELANWRVEQNRHLAFSQAVVEAADKSIAHHQAGAALIPQTVREVTCEQFRRIDEIGERIEAANQGGNIGLADHHPTEEHELGNRRTNAPKISAEQAPIEWL